MKKLSTFQITLLAVFGACAVAGVLIFALFVGKSNTSAVGPVVIWGTVDGPTFTSMIQDAANTYPALSGATYVEKNPSTYSSDITEALASGNGPDLFLITQDEAYQDAGEVMLIPYKSLSSTQFQNTFIEAANPFLLPGGIVALPVAADPLVLYWNKDILASAAYAQPPQYWDQLFDMATKMTTRDDAGTILKSAVALGEYKNIDDAKDILAALILQAGGVITSYDSTGRLDSAISKVGINPAEPAVETALRFFVEFADPSKNDYSWNGSLPEASQDFAQGNLALYIGYASEEPTIKKENPNLNFAVAPLPQIRNAAHTTDVARVYALAITHASKNTQGALAVAETLAASANSAAFATAFNLASARRDVLSQSSSGEQSLFNQATIVSYSWIDPDPEKTGALFQDMIGNTTSGAMLIGDAVGRADAQMTQIIGGK
ncbi:MAG TPA: extracellular solute-binding protein [Candidatus Paceibacterota bacterium]|nr:extracellular solute-binding protein [Candidatus Paceibacterota bacterium]